MIKKTLVAGLLAISACISAPAMATSFEDTLASTLKIGNDNRPFCSAIAISPNQLVTAGHCVDGGSEIVVYKDKLAKDFTPLERTIIYTKTLRLLKDKDVAFLEVTGDYKFDKYMDVASAKDVEGYLKPGAYVGAVGYPMAVDLTYTEGKFTNRVPSPMPNDLPTDFYKTTIPITGGNSGGGLVGKFGENDYKLMGLASAGYRHVSFMSYFSVNESLQSVMVGLVKVKQPVTKDADAEDAAKKNLRWEDLVNPSDLK